MHGTTQESMCSEPFSHGFRTQLHILLEEQHRKIHEQVNALLDKFDGQILDERKPPEDDAFQLPEIQGLKLNSSMAVDKVFYHLHDELDEEILGERKPSEVDAILLPANQGLRLNGNMAVDKETSATWPLCAKSCNRNQCVQSSHTQCMSWRTTLQPACREAKNVMPTGLP